MHLEDVPFTLPFVEQESGRHSQGPSRAATSGPGTQLDMHDRSVEQSTALELAICPRAAQLQGLGIPQDLLLRADEVIQ